MLIFRASADSVYLMPLVCAPADYRYRHANLLLNLKLELQLSALIFRFAL
jgi:hypothetical protein